MKVLVTVKEVAAVEDDFEIDGLSIDDRYLEYDLNEWDDYAVESAVQIAEAADEDVEVVAATIGPERSEETIRMALAKGADRAVRVWDDAIAEQTLLDVNAKVSVFEQVIAEEEPDLVLTGVQAGDDAFGATGVALANRVGYRELEGGIEEITEVDLPAVLSIQTGINEPRYASLRGIRQAQQKEIAPHDLSDLGLDAEAVDGALELTEMYEPESESDATIFEGGAEETAAELASVLREKGVVGE